MRQRYAFIAAIAALLLLPIVPELWLCIRHYDDLKAFASIAYYECIVGVLLWSPTLLLPRALARGWVVVFGTITWLATLVSAFQAIAVGARWDSTAHAAVMETNSFEASGFLHAFVSATSVGSLGLLSAGFAAAIVVACRSVAPARRVAACLVAAGLLGSLYGIAHAIRYGGNPVHHVHVSPDTSVSVFDAAINSYHPVLRVLITHLNYLSAHSYRLKVLHEMNQHLAELSGATPVPGATPPRVMVIVIGESASRRHWSLYGYRRNTSPELAAYGTELIVYRDVICRTVGTLNEIQGMLCTHEGLLPVFAMFTSAGYRTHWLSAQLDQGPNDVKVAALVQSCDERVFLNGAYDEKLLPLVQRAVNEPGRQLILVNLFGSHVRYEDRYPASFAVFRGDDERAHRLATYDNSVRYTDHVLAEMISILRQRNEASCFLYVSDHAEDVYDSDPDHYLFRSDSVARDAMYEIPMVVWFSPSYRKENPALVQAAAAAVGNPFQTVGLYQSLIDLARLRHPLFLPQASLFSPEYVPHERHVGAAARIYHPASGAAASAR